MSDQTCLRCKKILDQWGNHCKKCIPLVRENYARVNDLIERLREEADAFARGEET